MTYFSEAQLPRSMVRQRSLQKGKSSLPFVVRLLRDFPALRQLPARFIGIGPRPEHVQSPTSN